MLLGKTKRWNVSFILLRLMLITLIVANAINPEQVREVVAYQQFIKDLEKHTIP